MKKNENDSINFNDFIVPHRKKSNKPRKAILR